MEKTFEEFAANRQRDAHRTQRRVAFYIVILSVLFMAAMAVVRGMLFAQMWAWFVVEPFHAPPLGIGHAIGVTFMLGGLIQQLYEPVQANDPAPLGTFVGKVVGGIVGILFLWGIAAIVHACIS